MRKPNHRDGMLLDIHWEQFSEQGDPPNIDVKNENDFYEFAHFVSLKDIKQEIKKMRKDAEWLLKAASYVESKLVNDEIIYNQPHNKT